MSEPDWEEFRVDGVFDTQGKQMAKLYAFMAAFLDWRREVQASGQVTDVRNQANPPRLSRGRPRKVQVDT